MNLDEDIKLPLYGEALKGSLLPRNVKAILVSDRLIFARWGVRGWTQLSLEEDKKLRAKLGL